jgi:putative inorganic carbon (HCO3(-)) transporter
MRDYIVFATIFGLLPFILKRPALGAMVFAWVSLMNPHRLCYGPAYNFPFAALVTAVTLISLVFTKQPRRLPFRPATLTLIAFMLWFTFTSFFALEPLLVWGEWSRVTKTIFMVLISIMALNSERDIKEFSWVVGLSLGFYGLKGGIFTLASGGVNHVFGPDGSYIAENNGLALALVTTLPIIWYLHMQAHKKWLRRGLLGLTIFTIISVAGSYSRGALVAGAAMLFFLWLKSRNKMTTGLILLLLVPVVYAVMPDQWFARMGTIDAYNQDASALGRFNAWHFAINVATHNFLGGGFDVFTPHMFLIYAPEPLNYHVAHSIYFQVLGEQGPVGLIIYLFLMIFSWRTGTRIIKFCKNRPDLKWASDLAAMSQVSIVGYSVGGAFLSLAYFDLYYDIIALLVILEKFLFLASPKMKGQTISPSIQPQAENRSRAT